MKKLISFCLALTMAASMAACSQGGGESSSQAAGESSSSAVEESSAAGGSSSITESSGASVETPETVTITSLNGEGAETQLEVPYDPQRIAILDMASLDILDALGVVESVRKNANTIASLFGLEEEVNSLMADFDSRIATLAEFAEGKTAIVGLVTSGGFNVLGNDGRCSMICREVGFENIGVDAEIDTATHGNEASFEFVVEKDPDYIFVLDRDAAIQTEGAQLAQEIVENELIKGTRAYTEGHIVYLSSPAVWYTAEGGITALDVMLQDLESELLPQ